MGRDDQEERKPSYQCQDCGCLFFSLENIQWHKSMTGHGKFIERKRQ